MELVLIGPAFTEEQRADNVRNSACFHCGALTGGSIICERPAHLAVWRGLSPSERWHLLDVADERDCPAEWLD